MKNSLHNSVRALQYIRHLGARGLTVLRAVAFRSKGTNCQAVLRALAFRSKGTDSVEGSGI
jgi:hypothetical protein